MTTPTKVLVCGGAGYVGSHAVNRLILDGYDVIVIDNLSTGHSESLLISPKARLYTGDMRIESFMDSVFTSESPITAVLHFAADSLVGESVTHPLKYYDNNVGGAVTLLKTMAKHKTHKIIFSSTAAVYGESQYSPIDEKHPTMPTSPYGKSKLMIEKIFEDCDSAYGIKFISLRYFNVAGAHMSGAIGEDHKCETHLIPLVLKVAIGLREKISVFGGDWATRDGTCIRDYIHMDDLIEAHVLALGKLVVGGESGIYNLGTETGSTVLEVIEGCRRVTGCQIPTEFVGRRAGDPEVLVASY
jgi:UDP-glucose 4-epimerase